MLAEAAGFAAGVLLPPHATANGTIAVAPRATKDHVLALRLAFMKKTPVVRLSMRPCEQRWRPYRILQRVGEGRLTPCAAPRAGDRSAGPLPHHASLPHEVEGKGRRLGGAHGGGAPG